MTPKSHFGKDELHFSPFQFLPDGRRSACLSAVTDHQENTLLKGVSRSFYLSLRMLPCPMRSAASLGYLLARTSDTLADAPGVPDDARLECLEHFNQALAGSPASPWPARVVASICDAREKELLSRTGALLAWLDRLPTGEASLVREVLEIITGGQMLDIQRFAGASAQRIITLPDDAALEDYTWRVAGCVGAFWTKLGFLTLGESFAVEPEEKLLDAGIAYGKGLQLVNILRDLPEDLRNGRCYLPVENPENRDLLLDTHQKWLDQTEPMIAAGFRYAKALRSRRLRAASVLPALLARETLQRMRGATWEALGKRIKVPRLKVYAHIFRAFC